MSRFSGNNGKRLLREALGQQHTLGCSPTIITKIAQAASLKEHLRDSRLIIQGSDDNRIAFILRGSVDIFIKGEKVATRSAGEHVGEMSVIDPKARRSATVVATEDTEVAWIDEKDFSRIAKAHPELWRALAVELAERLRQRGASVRDRNEIPHLFIGSSSESLKVAAALARQFQLDPMEVLLWKHGVFEASDATIEGLEKLLPTTDFAVLVLTADDSLKTRKRKQRAPRDNVIFELGLFMGAIGRKRTFMLVEKRRQALRLPPDLSGVTYIEFDQANAKVLRESLADAVLQIRKRVADLHVR